MWHVIHPVLHWRKHGAQKTKLHECCNELINFGIDLHFYILVFINKTSRQVLQFDSQVHTCIDQHFIILNHLLL